MPARNGRSSLRTWTIAGVLGGAFVVILLAAPSHLAAQDELAAARKLQSMNAHIEKARQASDRRQPGVRKGIENAEADKVEFLEIAFEGQDIHGCSAVRLIFQLDQIDRQLTGAKATDAGSRKKFLSGAKQAARGLTEGFRECLPEDERAIAGEIGAAARRLLNQFAKETLTDEKLRAGAAEVADLKRGLIAGQTVFGCDVFDFFALIESIDGALVTAAETDGKERGSRLRKAEKDGGELLERWRAVPCEETTPPPPDGAFTVQADLSWHHVNGFGNPPSRECNFVSTSPAQPGAQVTDVITRPNPQPQVTKTATTNASGDAVVSMNIDQTGTYTHQTTVTSQSGVQATDTESQTVTAQTTGANGQCPPPTP